MSSSTRSILLFLGKMLGAYLAWYALYDLWLLPDGRLDKWVSLSVVQVGEFALGLVGLEPVATARRLTLPGAPGIQVVDGCNGLASIGLFVGFVMAFPGRAWRRVLFIPLGILAVFLSNVGRVTGLLLLQTYWDTGFEVAHSVGAPIFFYAVIFGLWVLWANYGGAALPSSGSDDPSNSDEQTRRALA